MRRSLALVLLAALTVTAACSDDDGGDDAADATTTTTVGNEGEAPDDDAFYEPPDDLERYDNGDLIRYAVVDAPEGAVAWKVLYRSESLAGDPVAVSGMVGAPDGEAPAGGRPVLTWAHGTTGTADRCAPSEGEEPSTALFAFGSSLERGWVAAATDYEGLGTPGLHPYLVGESQGRGVLDIARAAQELPGSGANGEVAIWGVSQGGHAALFAASLAPTWAPDLDVLGVVAAAPPGDLTVLGAAAASPVLAGFALMVGGGYQAAYGDVNLDEVLGADQLPRLDVLEEECVSGVFESTDADPLVLASSPLDVEPWPQLLADNSPVNLTYDLPVLILQGEDDAIVPKGLTDQLAASMCDDGVLVDYRTFPETGHGEEIGRNFPAALEWIAERFAGDTPRTTCT